MARPLKPEESAVIKKQFIELFYSKNGMIYTTCKQVGIPVQTYQYWMAHDPKFENEVKSILETIKDEREDQLLNRTATSDTCLIFYLKTKAKDRGYVERVEQTGKDGGAIESKTETIVTQNTTPVAQSILEEYEKAILSVKDTKPKAADKHIN